jgi:hypothetical protein
MTTSDHNQIWLEPKAESYDCEGRQWCQDNVWDDGVRYLHAEAVEAVEAEIEKLAEENARLNEAASERWVNWKHTEKLNRQLEEALKGLWYVVKSEPTGVPNHLKADLHRAEQILEIVASERRERRS